MISRLLIFIVLLSGSIGANSIPYKIELGTYFPGLSAFKKENGHILHVAGYYQNDLYSKISYRYAKQFEMNAGAMINHSARDTLYNHLFLNNQLHIKARLNPFFVTGLIEKHMQHGIISYKDRVGLSMLKDTLSRNLEQNVDLELYSLFSAIEAYKVKIKGSIAGLTCDNKDGYFYKIGLDYQLPVNGIHHHVGFQFLKSSLKQSGYSYKSNHVFLHQFYSELYNLTVSNKHAFHVRYSVKLDLDYMTFDMNIEALPEVDLYLLKLSHHYSLNNHMGFLTQLYVSTQPDANMIRIKYIWQR